MPASTTPDAVATLELGLRELREVREVRRRTFDREDAELERQARAIEATIQTLRGDKPLGTISEERYGAVLSCLEKGEQRQVDIAKKTKLNSGSVSIALRKAEQEGLLERVGKVDGSTLWRKCAGTEAETSKGRNARLSVAA